MNHKTNPLPEIILPGTNHYRNIHQRIRIKYGKANKCENPNCEGKSVRFDWSLKKGHSYSVDIADYEMLCRVCHALQDTAKGEKQSEAKLTELDVLYIKCNPDNLTQKELAAKFCVIRQTINAITTNRNWKHIKV